MELCSLHPFEEETVREFVASLSGNDVGSEYSRASGARRTAARRAMEQIEQGDQRGTYALTYALGCEMASRQPSFAHAGISLSSWEARVDRGVGMLLRPPSRLLIDAGLDPVVARALPIRLEMSRGMMGGAFVPARLVGELERLLDARIERTVRRLNESELDGVAVLGLMLELAAYCRSNGLGIYEAMDVVSPDGYSANVVDARVITSDITRLDKAVRLRLETAAKPPKKPGFLSRLTRHGRAGEQGGQMGRDR